MGARFHEDHKSQISLIEGHTREGRMRDLGNLALLTDLYQLTMVGGYVQEGKREQWANFDYFFRKVPDDGGYCVLAGLADLIEYLQNLRFGQTELAYLETLGLFPQGCFGLSGIIQIHRRVFGPYQRARWYSLTNPLSGSGRLCPKRSSLRGPAQHNELPDPYSHQRLQGFAGQPTVLRWWISA